MSYDTDIKDFLPTEAPTENVDFDTMCMLKLLDEVAHEERQKGSKSPDRSARRKVLQKKSFQLGSYKR